MIRYVVTLFLAILGAKSHMIEAVCYSDSNAVGHSVQAWAWPATGAILVTCIVSDY